MQISQHFQNHALTRQMNYSTSSSTISPPTPPNWFSRVDSDTNVKKLFQWCLSRNNCCSWLTNLNSWCTCHFSSRYKGGKWLDSTKSMSTSPSPHSLNIPERSELNPIVSPLPPTLTLFHHTIPDTEKHPRWLNMGPLIRSD